MSETQTPNKTKKIIDNIVNVVLWIFLVFSIIVTMVVFSAQSNDGIPSIFGNSVINIVSDSMKPIFKTGDMIIIEKVKTEDVHTVALEIEKAWNENKENGPIITYYADIDGDGRDAELETHRVVGVRVDGGHYYFETMGDNPDMSHGKSKEVRMDKVVGVYNGTRIAGVGGVINFLSGSLGFFLCVVLPLILFFLYELYNFILIVIRTRRENAPAPAAAAITPEAEEEIRRRAIEEYLASQAQQAQESAPEEEPTVTEDAGEETSEQ